MYWFHFPITNGLNIPLTKCFLNVLNSSEPFFQHVPREVTLHNYIKILYINLSTLTSDLGLGPDTLNTGYSQYPKGYINALCQIFHGSEQVWITSMTDDWNTDSASCAGVKCIQTPTPYTHSEQWENRRPITCPARRGITTIIVFYFPCKDTSPQSLNTSRKHTNNILMRVYCL